jgi:hypothetical protein
MVNERLQRESRMISKNIASLERIDLRDIFFLSLRINASDRPTAPVWASLHAY